MSLFSLSRSSYWFWERTRLTNRTMERKEMIISIM